MESELVGIGTVARRSGLTVSALRYYDEAGVLVPAVVDPASGYRFYSLDQVRLARLVARLRRVGMPVADLRRVVGDPQAAGPLLDAHLRRLEHALADARRELSAARSLLEEETSMTVTVTTTDAALVAALRAVRFAVGSDPELPAIAGVLLDATPEDVRLVATDRYRLAIAPLEGAAVAGPATQALLPTPWVDQVLDRLAGPGRSPQGTDVVVEVSHDSVVARVPGGDLATGRPPVDYPDYRRLVREHGSGVLVEARTLQARIEAAPPLEHPDGAHGVPRMVALLARDGAGITVAEQPGEGAVAFDREFLLEAVEAADGAPLTLALDGPHEPLVIRTGRGDIGLLMPVALS